MGLMETLYRIKEFLVAGIQALPIIIAAVSLLLACGTANTGFAILFLFISAVVPFATFLLNKAAPMLQIAINWIYQKVVDKNGSLDFSVPDNGICKIVASSVASPGIAYPSYWMSSIIFFFSFIFFNGLSLYNYATTQEADNEKVSSRKTHAIIGMILSLGMMFGLFVWRLTTDCESKTGLGAVLALLFVGLAYGLYKAFEDCGLIRVIDLYGIGARLLPATATQEPTQVCFPVGK